MLNELKETRIKMSYQIEDINKEIEITYIRKEILELESTIIEIKNSKKKEFTTGFQKKIRSERRINKLENRSIEIIQFEEQKEKRMKNNKESLRPMGFPS